QAVPAIELAQGDDRPRPSPWDQLCAANRVELATRVHEMGRGEAQFRQRRKVLHIDSAGGADKILWISDGQPGPEKIRSDRPAVGFFNSRSSLQNGGGNSPARSGQLALKIEVPEKNAVHPAIVANRRRPSRSIRILLRIAVRWSPVIPRKGSVSDVQI